MIRYLTKTKSLLTVVLLALCVSLFSVVTFGEGQTNEVDIIIHRLMLKSSVSQSVQNDGITNPFDQQSVLSDYIGVGDKEFKAYDVTRDYLSLREKGLSKEEAQTELSRENSNTLNDLIMSQMTDDSGTALFHLPEKSGKEDAVYLFVETKQLDHKNAGNFVVVLPVFNDSKEKLTSIHLYPKTELEDEGISDLKKVADVDNAHFGQLISYSVTTDVPANIWTQQTFQIKDEADPSLMLVKGSIDVTVDGHEIKHAIENIEERDHGYTIDFIPPELMKYAGKPINIHYKMRLSKTAIADTDIINTVTLITDKEPIKKQALVRTGGQRFVKKDVDDDSKTLQNATFVILNEKGQILVQTNDGYAFEKIASKDLKNNSNTVRLMSDSQGEFEITGLAYGSYFLQEIDAPQGYILATERVPFDIKHHTYSLSSEKNMPLVIYNKQTPKSGGLLPKTGETIQNISFVIGVMMVIGFVLNYKKIRRSNKHENN